MNFGIVVEGDHDSAVYPLLVRKIRDDVENVHPIVCGGVATLKAKFVGWLKYFQFGASLPVDKVLVIIDSDCCDAPALEAQLNQIYQQSHFAPSFPVHFHATKCEIETWLLADEDAVNQVSQRRGKNKRVAALTIEFESYRDAKKFFQKVLSNADLPADPRVYQEIAAAADIGRIAARCPSFQQFAGKVRAC